MAKWIVQLRMTYLHTIAQWHYRHGRTAQAERYARTWHALRASLA